MSMMSLLNFGFTKKRSLEQEDGATCTDQNNNKDNKYDRNKRVRVFQKHWRDDRPWLIFDEDGNSMYCSFCRCFPAMADNTNVMTRGTTNLRIEPIKIHECTPEHFSCHRLWLKNQGIDLPKAKLADTALGKSIIKKKCSPEQANRYAVLFNTAYGVAKQGKPFSDFLYILNIQKKNKVDIGQQYLNLAGCKLFIRWITKQMKEGLVAEINESPFISILSDGSTDTGVIEQEIVYVRYVDVKQMNPVTTFVNIVELKSANADGVLNAILSALSDLKLDQNSLKHDTDGPKLVCANFDGASVNFGSKSGVFQKLKAFIPETVGIHCIAHKLELAILDANKKFAYMSVFEATMKGVFKFYFFSPKRRRELKEISELIENEFAHLGHIKGVRWLSSKERAVKALVKNLEAVVAHLEHCFASGVRSDDANKAKGYHTQVTSVNFIKLLYFLLDYLPLLTKLSKIFQEEKYLIFEASEHINIVLAQLLQLKNSEGKHMKEFCTNFDVDNKMFGAIKLQARGFRSVDFKTDRDLHQLIDDTISYIKSRFGNLNEKPLSLLKIFNFHQWPLGRGYELAEYGMDELQELVSCSQFHSIMSELDKSEVSEQFTEMKMYLSHFRTNNLLDVYSLFLKKKANERGCKEVSAIEKLIMWLFTVSPSTSSCERGFSTCNVIKNKMRTVLTTESLQNQLYIMTNGPPLEDFHAGKCVNYWFENSIGTPHSSGHNLKERDDNELDMLQVSNK